MIQLRVYSDTFEHWLDLYDEEPIKVTLQFDDFATQDTMSTYSRTFRVPNTRTNAQFFKSVFMVDGLDFDVTKKTSADILVDGALFREGHIRLNKIFVNKQADTIEYEVLFLGEIRNFASAVDGFSLCDLDLSGLGHTFSSANIYASWEAYPEGGLNDGLLNGNVLYPLIDYGNTYDSNGNVEQTEISLIGNPNFTQNQASGLTKERFKPMIRAKYVLDQIFAEAGFTYTSTILDSDLFRKIYVSAFGNEANVNIDDSINGYEIKTRVKGSWFNETTSTVYVRVLVNGVPIASQTQQDNGTPNSAQVFDKTITITYNLLANDTVEVETYIAGDGDQLLVESADSYFQIVNAPRLNDTMLYTLSTDTFGDQMPILWDAKITDPNNNYSTSTGQYTAPVATSLSVLFDCEYKQIDFIQDILKLGRLVMVPDLTNPRNFIIETWDEYIASGVEWDWSDKLDHITDIEIEPLFYTQKADHDFKYTDDSDYINDYHQRAFKQSYGYIRIESQNELLKEIETTQLALAATPVNHIRGTSSLTDNFVIPQLHTADATDLGTQHNPIKPITRLMFYNGKQYITKQTDWWYLFDLGTAINFFPLVSKYSDWPMNNNTLHLTWSVDRAYFGRLIPGVDPTLGQGMYNRYWNNYIGEVYNSTARILRAYFVLNNSDITNIEFKDVVFVNGAWYRVNKIQDAPLGSTVPVLVELVKIIDYKPNYPVDVEPGDFTGDLPYEDPGTGTFGGSLGGFGGSQDPSYDRYYNLQICGGSETKVGVYNGTLINGQAVMLTGSGNVNVCWEVVNETTQQVATPIVLEFIDCNECNTELNP